MQRPDDRAAQQHGTAYRQQDPETQTDERRLACGPMEILAPYPYDFVLPMKSPNH